MFSNRTTQYSYSHNGQEKDAEIFDGALSAEYWEYDSRVIRRWEVDPISYAWQSPYACFNNNPISFADPLGLEGEGEGDPEKPTSGEQDKGGESHTTRAPKTKGPFDRESHLEDSSPGGSDKKTLSDGSSGGNFLHDGSLGSAGGITTPIMIRPLILPAIPIGEALWAALEAYLARAAAGAATGALSTAVAITGTGEDETYYGKWMVYEITYNEFTKDGGVPIAFNHTYKYGISGQDFNKDGSHPRPETQVISLNALEATIANDASYATIRIYSSREIVRNVSKITAEYVEQAGVNYYFSTHGENPEGNKRPLADPLRGRTRKKFDKINAKDIFKFMKNIKK